MKTLLLTVLFIGCAADVLPLESAALPVCDAAIAMPTYGCGAGPIHETVICTDRSTLTALTGCAMDYLADLTTPYTAECVGSCFPDYQPAATCTRTHTGASGGLDCPGLDAMGLPLTQCSDADGLFGDCIHPATLAPFFARCVLACP